MKQITDEEAEALMRQTETVEDEKAARQAAREEKKRLKEAQVRQAFIEKLVAPILLIVTIIISLILWLLHSH